MISFKMEGTGESTSDLIGKSFSIRLDLDYTLIFETFAKLHIALFIWLIMQLSTAIVVFMGFHTWINCRVYSGRNLSKNQ